MAQQKYNHIQTSPTQIDTYDKDGDLVSTRICSEPITNIDHCKLDEDVFSNVHYALYEASERGDYERFISLAPLASKNDLEWAIEVASNVQIVKYIINVCNITGFWFSCYTNALKHNNSSVMEFFESERLIDVLNRLKSDIYSYVFNSNFDVVTETFRRKIGTNNTEDEYEHTQRWIREYHLYRDRYTLLKEKLNADEVLLKRWSRSKLRRKASYFETIESNYYFSFSENDHELQNRYESVFPAFCMNYLAQYLNDYAYFDSTPCPENATLRSLFDDIDDEDTSKMSLIERDESDRLVRYHIYKNKLAKLLEINSSNEEIMDTYYKLRSF